MRRPASRPRGCARCSRRPRRAFTTASESGSMRAVRAIDHLLHGRTSSSTGTASCTCGHMHADEEARDGEEEEGRSQEKGGGGQEEEESRRQTEEESRLHLRITQRTQRQQRPRHPARRSLRGSASDAAYRSAGTCPSVRVIASDPSFIIAPTLAAASSGRRSAIQITRLPPAPFAKT